MDGDYIRLATTTEIEQYGPGDQMHIYNTRSGKLFCYPIGGLAFYAGQIYVAAYFVATMKWSMNRINWTTWSLEPMKDLLEESMDLLRHVEDEPDTITYYHMELDYLITFVKKWHRTFIWDFVPQHLPDRHTAH